MSLKIIKIIFTDFNMTMKYLQASRPPPHTHTETLGFRAAQFECHYSKTKGQEYPNRKRMNRENVKVTRGVVSQLIFRIYYC